MSHENDKLRVGGVKEPTSVPRPDHQRRFLRQPGDSVAVAVAGLDGLS